MVLHKFVPKPEIYEDLSFCSSIFLWSYYNFPILIFLEPLKGINASNYLVFRLLWSRRLWRIFSTLSSNWRHHLLTTSYDTGYSSNFGLQISQRWSSEIIHSYSKDLCYDGDFWLYENILYFSCLDVNFCVLIPHLVSLLYHISFWLPEKPLMWLKSSL